ncbi:MAG: exodeoxyribonuclease V subunit alpha [Deltaproteobacteria bacterium]|nr:exodeoxyribonuclease V subunit alpha [Deltaproteobacteria bacterium]
MRSRNSSSLESHFAGLLRRLAGNGSPELGLAAALVARQVAQGHICLDLQEFAGREIARPDGGTALCPVEEEWIDALQKSGVVGAVDEWKPLILDPPLLYLQRYWQYEQEVADFILARGSMRPADFDGERLAQGLARLFPQADPQETEPDWQKEAAHKALSSRFCVISGGPGTGKTTTVARILALFCELGATEESGRILLAAPTGKAAARLQEAIRQARTGLNCAPEVKAAIPETAVTLHRLLGSSPHGRRYQRKNLLPASLVVVDEASMVDLPLMAWLMTALPEKCTLLLLGDQHQLSSVQPGAVLGDICRGLRQGGADRSLAELRKSYRFPSGSGIGALSRMVYGGDGEGALAVLQDDNFPDVSWFDMGADPDQLRRRLLAAIGRHHQRTSRATTPAEALAAMGEFAVLSALRGGPFGVEQINLQAAEMLSPSGGGHFHGRPVMVTSNDYGLQLYNGDTGLILQDGQAAGQLRAFFPAGSGVRRLLPARLPAHETAFAVTVHKSQGSEFAHVLLILPAGSSPVLCRELVYTGITRATRSVEVWGDRNTFLEAIKSPTRRRSGLVKALAG